MGGDEFAVVLQREDYENREALMAEFKRRSGEENVKAVQPWEQVNVSMGMAVFEPGNDEKAGEVVTRADQLMYMAKRQSRTV